MTKDNKNTVSMTPNRGVRCESKTEIANVITKQRNEKALSIRNLAKKADMKHPQIMRLTNGQNVTVDTLLNVLEQLDLEIVIQSK